MNGRGTRNSPPLSNTQILGRGYLQSHSRSNVLAVAFAVMTVELVNLRPASVLVVLLSSLVLEVVAMTSVYLVVGHVKQKS